MSIFEKLEFILQRIEEFNKTLTIHSGLMEEEITSALKTINVTPTQDIIDLYAWHDGIEGLDNYLDFMRLSKVVSMVKDIQKFPIEITDFIWTSEWLPLLSLNGADVFILLNNDSGEVASLDIELDSFKLIASNYKDYIDAMHFVFYTKQYSIDGFASTLKLSEKVWDELDAKFKIKPAWS